MSSSSRVPPTFGPALRRLLETHLDSFEKLEIVVTLRRAPAYTSSVKELTSALQLPIEVVEHTVAELARGSLVEVAGGLTRLVLRGDELDAVSELVEVYDQDRLLVVRALSEISVAKIRGMAARTFADAFQLRKKKGGDDG